MITGRRVGTIILLATALALGSSTPAGAVLPPIKHVFVIVLENESVSTTFGPGSPAPYLATDLVRQGRSWRATPGSGTHRWTTTWR